MVAAGDTWVALACGRHFDQHGVNNVEPFSFNSHPAGPTDEQLKDWPQWTRGIIRYWHPTGWINQNWLTHLTFYKLVSWFGTGDQYNYNMLVYWKFALYVLTVFVVFATGKTMGAGNFLSAAAACLAMVVGRSFFDIRPAGYSNLLAPAFVLILALTTYRHWQWIWLLVPLVVFWANVHGGYIYAFIMLVPFIGIHLLVTLPRRWTISLGAVGLWLVLYLLSYKFATHAYTVAHLKPENASLSLIANKFLILWGVLAAGSVALAAIKNIKPQVFYLYHALAGLIYFASTLSLYFMQMPLIQPPKMREILMSHVSSSQFSFVLVAAGACLLILAMAFKKERFVVLPVKGLIHTVAAGIVSFVAMVILNPYHLTNLTHTFEISVSKHAESWRQVNEWKPAFDWLDKTATGPNPVGYEEWFGVMCILTAVVLLLWLVSYFLMRPSMGTKTTRKGAEVNNTGGFQWPKVDLAILVISLMTIYMAVQSRRFIALAGSASAPAVFLLIQQTWRMITARAKWNVKGRLEPVVIPPAYITFIYAAAAIGLLYGGIQWGRTFEQVYLAPWPAENKYTSIFMRMTASHIKPFEVCDFINLNQLKGRVFNYWTEGGAVAFGEKPDPKTGEIPLKLFMDGRAQAAYNHDVFQLWQGIHSGGARNVELMRQGKELKDWTTKDFQYVGAWIDEQLKERQVWIALMPNSQDGTVFMRSLSSLANWKTGYIDTTQHVLIDITSEPGKKLLDAILEGKATFPDAISKSLTTATAIFENNYMKRANDLYAIAKEGFDVFPYPAVTAGLTRVSGMPMFKENVIADLKNYLEEFKQNKAQYEKENGYLLRLTSAEIAARFLAQRDEAANRSSYTQTADLFKAESRGLTLDRLW